MHSYVCIHTYRHTQKHKHMKIHIYLFAYIFIYNEKHIYNIDGVRGVRGVGGLAGSSGFGVRGSFPPFVSPSSFLTWWWVQLCPRLAQHRLGVLHILLSFRWLFPFLCCVCHRFAPSLLLSNTWSTGFCAEHLLTRIIFLNMAFSKTLVYTHALV